MKFKKSGVNKRKSKKKKWIIIGIVVLVLLCIGGAGGGDKQDEHVTADIEQTTEATTEPTTEANTDAATETTTQPTTQQEKDSTTKQETKEAKKEATEKEKNKSKSRKGAIGKSDKNIKQIKNISPQKVRNDSTGKWRFSMIAENIDFLEYSLSYYNKYFKKDDEIHAMVNFTKNTTTKISDFGDFLDVTIYEYVKGEEHDANLLFSGMVYGEYFVYKDNGDIVKTY